MTTTRPRPQFSLTRVAVLGAAAWFAAAAGPAAAQVGPEETLPADTSALTDETTSAAGQAAPEETMPADTSALALESTSAAAAQQAPPTSLELSEGTGLDPAGQLIVVTGHGFTSGQGVYVMFCAQPAGPLGTEAGRADTCNPDQSNDHTVWKTPVGTDGTFTVDLRVESRFESTDCATTICGVFVRRDHMGGATDYSQDAFVAVSFAAAQEPAPPTEPAQVSPGSGGAATVQGASDEARLADTGARSAPPATLGITLLALGAVLLGMARRHRPAVRA